RNARSLALSRAHPPVVGGLRGRRPRCAARADDLARYTCDGEDVSPGLRWSDVPDGAASPALTCEDPDAPGGTFTHWVTWRPVCLVAPPAKVAPRYDGVRWRPQNGGKIACAPRED